MEFSLKTVRNDFIKKNGIFHTKHKLALYLKEKLKEYVKEDIKEVCDLCCGNGNLLEVFDNNVEKYGADIIEDFVDNCKNKFKNFEQNFLQKSIFENPFNRKFKYIVSNAPFGLKDKNISDIYYNLDCAFIEKNIEYLSDDGVMAVINTPSIFYRNKDKKFIKYLLQNNILECVEWLDNKEFFDDTSICVVIIIINKQKKDDFIILKYEDTLEKVNRLDLLKNDMNISKPYPELKKEDINIREIYTQTCQSIIKTTELKIKQQKMIMELDCEKDIYKTFIKNMYLMVKKYHDELNSRVKKLKDDKENILFLDFEDKDLR